MERQESKPVYKGNVIYADMADNLNRITFPVIVTESYNPNVHWSFLGVDTDPVGPQYFKKMYKIPTRPIFDPGPNESDAPAHARLTGSYIIDALVNGHKISFENPDDMYILADWIECFLNTHSTADINNFPEKAAFCKNARTALNMLRGNLTLKEVREAIVRPKPLTASEMLSML